MVIVEVVAIIGVTITIVGVGTKVLMDKLSDRFEIVDRDIKALATTVDKDTKAVALNADRDARELRHDLKNERARVDALQQLDLDKEKRVLKLESAVSNIERSQDRIEKMVEKGFSDLATSIREIRVVAPKP